VADVCGQRKVILPRIRVHAQTFDEYRCVLHSRPSIYSWQRSCVPNFNDTNGEFANNGEKKDYYYATTPKNMPRIYAYAARGAVIYRRESSNNAVAFRVSVTISARARARFYSSRSPLNRAQCSSLTHAESFREAYRNARASARGPHDGHDDNRDLSRPRETTGSASPTIITETTCP